MTFEDLNLSKGLLSALSDLKMTTPTTIQAKTFSVVMSGRDVQAIAQTGTGKTFAYLLPLLRLWKFNKERHAQILLVVPTRELVAQVVEQAKSLCTYINAEVVGVYGGTNLRVQAAEVAQGLDILVGTPGRLLDLGYHGALNLKMVKKLVIDEVDEMLQLGFRSQLEHLFELLPDKRQNLLFSATMSEDVEALIANYFNTPEKIEAAPSGSPLSNINQIAYEVPNFNTKINLLKHLMLTETSFTKVLIFVSTKAMADTVFEILGGQENEKIGLIHSNKDQNYRFNAVNSLKDGTFTYLIATDIIARGLDIDDVSHVINFDLPDEIQNYIHRIGRTGRADRKGESIALVSDVEKDLMLEIEAFMSFDVPKMPIPTEVEISDVLTDDELPKIQMRNVLGKVPKLNVDSSAYHEKKAKNTRVTKKVNIKEKMHAKYGKPITRGQKGRKKK